MLMGYARVSTQEQETHLQTAALRKAGVDVIYQEKKSGGDRNRPVLKQLVADMKAGDTLVVFKLDRIARSLKHLLDILEELEGKGAGFRSLTETIDTTTPAGRMMMQIIGAFAEFERCLIAERTRAGIRAAKARGVVFGRNYGIPLEEQPDMIRKWRSGVYTKSALAREYGVHISSVKRTIKRFDQVQQPRLDLVA
jgi:DNA invertase Pin-like site-specific DNA recombinase